MILKFIREHQILIAALIVVLFLFLTKRSPDYSKEVKEAYQNVLKAKEQEAAAIARERDIYREWKNEAVADKERADSILQLKDKAQIVKYATIPIYVNTLSRDSLRAEVLRFSK